MHMKRHYRTLGTCQFLGKSGLPSIDNFFVFNRLCKDSGNPFLAGWEARGSWAASSRQEKAFLNKKEFANALGY